MQSPLRRIKGLFAQGAYLATSHFVEEMRADVLFWSDIQAAIDGSTHTIDDGTDAGGDPKVRVRGKSLDDRLLEIVCVIKNNLVLVTVYTIEEVR